MIDERPDNVDSSTEPVLQIILHHHLTVRRHNAFDESLLFFALRKYQIFTFHCQRRELDNVHSVS